MKPTVSITGGDRIVQRIRELRDRLTKQNGVLVGVPKGAGNYEDGTKMAVIAAVQEYGSADGRIPERSFLRVPLSAEQRRFAETFRRMTPAVIHGKAPMRQMLTMVGEQAAGVAKEAISAGINPPNAPSTVKRKGSSTPLVDTGALRQAITYVIEGDEGA